MPSKHALHANPTAEDRTWFGFVAAANDNDPAEILIYDYIGSYGVTASSFDHDLKAMGVPKSKKAVMRVNSPGGETPTAASIYNMLERWLAKNDVELTVIVDGIAASSASWIAMLGDEVVMPDNTLMMIHDPSGLAYGTSREMRSLASVLDRIKQGMVSAYMKKSGQSKEDVEAIMEAETWYSAQEAVDAGFADRVDNPIDIAAAVTPSFDAVLQRYRFPPAPVEARVRIDATQEDVSMTTTPKAETPAEMEARIRAEVTASLAPAPKPEPVVASEPKVETAAEMQARITAEVQKTVAEVNSLCVIAGKPGLAAGFIAAGKTVDEVRAALEASVAAPKPQANALNTHAGAADVPNDASLTVSRINTANVWANYKANKGTPVQYNA